MDQWFPGAKAGQEADSLGPRGFTERRGLSPCSGHTLQAPFTVPVVPRLHSNLGIQTKGVRPTLQVRIQRPWCCGEARTFGAVTRPLKLGPFE